MDDKDLESNLKTVLDRVNALAEDFKVFRLNVEKRVEKVERLVVSPEEKVTLSTSISSLEVDLGSSVLGKRVTIQAGFHLSEDLVASIDELHHKIRRSLPHKIRKKISKSIVAEMLLRAGLEETKDERKRDQHLKPLLGQIG
jgi:ribosome-associated translation inhibitor RaiA